MTTPTDLAQALRELASDWRNKEVGETCDANAGYNRARKHCAAELEKVLKAHESRAQPAEPDGYAYRYADGFLRFNQGAPVNGGKPIEAIPFYFAPPPAQPASVAGWQPIETAPRTGRTLILLLTPSGWPQVAYSNTWWVGGFSVECQPTKWAPIPQPPEKTGDPMEDGDEWPTPDDLRTAASEGQMR